MKHDSTRVNTKVCLPVRIKLFKEFVHLRMVQSKMDEIICFTKFPNQEENSNISILLFIKYVHFSQYKGINIAYCQIV